MSQPRAINPSEFDINKLKISKAKSNKFGNVSQVLQEITYDGGKLYVRLPRQSTFGFSYSAGVGEGGAPSAGERKEVKPSEAKSIQVTYPIGETVNLTPEEQAVQDMFTQIRQAVFDSLVEEVRNNPADEETGETESAIGPTQFSVISAGVDSGKFRPMNYYIKDPFAGVKDQNTKQIDPNKPKRAYFKVLHKVPKTKDAAGKWVPTGDGVLIEAKIRVYEADGKTWRLVENCTIPDDINGSKGGYGHITPVVHISGTFIGAHGQNTHIASVQCKVVNAKYEKRSGSREAHDFFEDDEGGFTAPARSAEVHGTGFDDLTAAAPQVAPRAESTPVPKPKFAKKVVQRPGAAKGQRIKIAPKVQVPEEEPAEEE